MNLARISELKSLIDGLYQSLRKLKDRKDNLERIYPGTGNAQNRVDEVAVAARNRLSSLAAFGMRAEFLEEILNPIRNAPDCSGIPSTVKNEISGTENSIEQTRGKIYAADQERIRLEMEQV